MKKSGRLHNAQSARMRLRGLGKKASGELGPRLTREGLTHPGHASARSCTALQWGHLTHAARACSRPQTAPISSSRRSRPPESRVTVTRLMPGMISDCRRRRHSSNVAHNGEHFGELVADAGRMIGRARQVGAEVVGFRRMLHLLAVDFERSGDLLPPGQPSRLRRCPQLTSLTAEAPPIAIVTQRSRATSDGLRPTCRAPSSTWFICIRTVSGSDGPIMITPSATAPARCSIRGWLADR